MKWRLNLKRMLSLRAKRSEDPQSPENKCLEYEGIAGQARNDKAIQRISGDHKFI